MKIAVMGAGGIGGYIGARLAEAGQDVAFIARGAHLSALRTTGLTISSSLGDCQLRDIVVSDDPAHIGPVDLVLFTVKLYDTEAAARTLPPLISRQTRVLTFQNGVDSIDTLSLFVPRRQIAGGATYLAAEIAGPGLIRHSGGYQRTIVEMPPEDDTMTSFYEAAQRTIGVQVETTKSIGRVLWEKFIRFAAFAAATSLMRTTAGQIMGNSEARALLQQLIEEGVAVAAASGNPVAADFTDASMTMFSSLAPTSRSSMAADLERGRRLELPWVSGRINDLGLKLRVPTPAHTAAYRGLIIYADGKRDARSADV
jgi:2-dehydropantoate 2-reductase